MNVLLLWMAGAAGGYSDPRWLTFRQAQELGGTVRKGEKGTHIVLLKTTEKTKKNDDGEEYQDRYSFLKYFVVFSVEQCEGLEKLKPLPEPEIVEIGDPEKLLAKSGATIEYGGDRAAYLINSDKIRMPIRKTFRDEADFIATGFHELVHWTGHESRLARETLGAGLFGSTTYAEEELVAEMGAAFLCAAYGIEGKLQHAEYIGSWIKKLRDDERVIFRTARAAENAAEFLRERLGE